MNLPQRVLAAVSLSLLSAGPARADLYHVFGKVLDAVPALAPYGVVRGAAVEVDWTVDPSTPVTTQSPAPDNKSDYPGALDFLIIKIGSWQAILVAPASAGQNIISVADASNGPLDLLHIATPGTDENLVLHGPAMGGVLVLSLDFYAPMGGASENQDLDQDPNRYPLGVGSAIGAGGFVTFSLGSGKLPPGGGSSRPTAKCDTTKLGSASTLCLSQFKCHAAYAKAPQKDPLAEARDDCIANAGNKFVTAYNKAAIAAATKGLTCSTTEPASDVRTAITERVSVIADEPNAVTPADAPLVSSWLTSAGVACAGGLKAEAANAAKPSASKLEKARAKTSDKLTTAANNAVKLAVKKHVVFDPAPDVSAFVDSVDALIDDTSDQLTAN